MLALVHPSATPVWPPTGLALAAFLVLGYRVWPGILLGAFLANPTTTGTVATSIGIGTGNMLEGLVGAYLVSRFANGRNAFDRVQDFFKFVVLAPIVSTMVSATMGVTSLALGGFADWADYGPIWLTWWLGDASGDLIDAPLLILWSLRPHSRWARGQVLEIAVLLLSLFLIARIVFGGLLPFEIKNYPLEFACIPPLVWAAFRFGQREAATAVFVLSGLAVWGTLHGFGPFIKGTLNESLLLLQAFMGVIAVMTIAMAAVVSEHKRAEEALRASEHRLAGALDIAEAAVIERKAQTAALEFQAMHDVLTGLPNRILLQDRLRQAILAASRENQPVTLFVLDLDRFKEVNDTQGHQAGDLLLQQIGRRLQSTLRESDTVARLGGDEFAVVLPNVDLEGATLTAQKMLDLLEMPFSLEGVSVDVGVSIGIALFPEHSADADTLMRHADTAMYIAKQAGHGYIIYTSKDDKQSLQRLTLVSELRNAIEQEGLLLHYQPKIDLQTGRVIGVEALVRWQHPKNGLLLPEQFIPVAERSGLIRPLTLWVIKAALRQCHAWHQMGLDISIAVNLAPRNLHDPDLPHQITRSLKIYHVEPRLLELEIPERIAAADTARVLELLTRLSKAGVRLCIDDVGTGFSSLGHLKKLPVAEIKIDKSLILEMTTDEKVAVIVRSAIELGHHLDLKVVAKGVENWKTRDRLSDIGCDAAQGDYMSRPLPAVELTHWLTRPPDE